MVSPQEVSEKPREANLKCYQHWKVARSRDGCVRNYYERGKRDFRTTPSASVPSIRTPYVTWRAYLHYFCKRLFQSYARHKEEVGSVIFSGKRTVAHSFGILHNSRRISAFRRRFQAFLQKSSSLGLNTVYSPSHTGEKNASLER